VETPATARWMKPIMQRRAEEIRRDAVRVLRTALADRQLMVKAAERPAGLRPAPPWWCGRPLIT